MRRLKPGFAGDGARPSRREGKTVLGRPEDSGRSPVAQSHQSRNRLTVNNVTALGVRRQLERGTRRRIDCVLPRASRAPEMPALDRFRAGVATPADWQIVQARAARSLLGRSHKPHRVTRQRQRRPARQTAANGASRQLRRVPAIVSFLNPQPALSLVGGNRSSCPIPAARDSGSDRLGWVNRRSAISGVAVTPEISEASRPV